MSSEKWREAWRIYNLVRDLPDADRPAAVAAETQDPDIEQCVLELLETPPEEEIMPAHPVSRTGTQTGRYQIGDLLGRGGMGEVYAAQDTDLGRRVALKFVLPAAIQDSNAKSRLVREAKAASGLNHPNILTIYELIDTSSGLAIVMEYVEGQPLDALRGSPLTAAQVAAIGRQVASALDAAHGVGIAHRDLKPENLILRADGLVKVLDFGLARDFSGTAGLQTSATGLAAGTLIYMSPEQLRGESPGAPSDIFSLGILLYELAAGAHPFAEESGLEKAVAMQLRHSRPLRAVRPNAPEWLEELLASMLRRNPAERPTASQVAARLAEAPARPSTKLRWAPLAAAALLAIGLGAAAYWKNSNAGEAHRAADWQTAPFTGMPEIEYQPAFSPDGKQIAYAHSSEVFHPFAIYVKTIGGGPPVALPAAAEDNFNPAWSPDGRRLAFLRREPTRLLVMTMAARGGDERVVGEIINVTMRERLLTWRPDQKALVVTDLIPGAAKEMALWALPLDESPRLQLTAPPAGHSDIAPTYSPDGKTLAFLRRGPKTEIYLKPEGGEAQRLTFENGHMESLAWAPDGQSLLFNSRRATGRSVFRVKVTGGPPTRVAEIGGDPVQIAASPAGGAFAYVRNPDERTHLMQVDLPTGKTTRVTESAALDTDPIYSPDGERIAFASSRTGAPQLYVANSDGSNLVTLASLPDKGLLGSPRWSPDGKHLAFDGFPESKRRILLVNVETGHVQTLPIEGTLPAWSRDSLFLYFCKAGKVDNVWRVPVAGGREVQITRNGGRESAESPDGKYLYYSRFGGIPGIWKVPVDGGEETEVTELRAVIKHRYWAMGKTGFVFLDAPQRAVKRYRFDTGKVETLWSQSLNIVPGYRGLAISPDERRLLWVQPGPTIFQIMLVEGFR